MESVEEYRRTAEKCRRVADGMLDPSDPAVERLLDLADELDAKAEAAETAATDGLPFESRGQLMETL